MQFLNCVRTLENNLVKAVMRERKGLKEEVVKVEVKTDCIKYFIRGLKWEIRSKMNNPRTWQEAREQALSSEREFSFDHSEVETAKSSLRTFNEDFHETQRINIIRQDAPKCSFCNENNHCLNNCLGYAGYLFENSTHYDNLLNNLENKNSGSNLNERFTKLSNQSIFENPDSYFEKKRDGQYGNESYSS